MNMETQNSADLNISPAQLGKVAVLMGGASGEREVSIMSGTGVLHALKSKGVDAHTFDPSQQDLAQLGQQGFKRCFIALHGRYGEDGTVQGMLELLGIPYTGSGVLASSLAMDKIMTKRIWESHQLPTPPWRQVFSVQQTQQAFQELVSDQGAMIVKPSREGSSLGVIKVASLEACAQAYQKASEYDVEVLCESCIVGQELTCAVLDMQDGASRQSVALPVIHIIAPDGNYDFEHKYYSDATQYKIPCGLSSDEEALVKNLVLNAYKSIGCRSWARADIMWDMRTKKPYLLEINTSPGMTEHSLVPMAAQAYGMSYADLCLHVLAQATLDFAPKKSS